MKGLKLTSSKFIIVIMSGRGRGRRPAAVANSPVDTENEKQKKTTKKNGQPAFPKKQLLQLKYDHYLPASRSKLIKV